VCADPLLQHGHGAHAVSIVRVSGWRSAPETSLSVGLPILSRMSEQPFTTTDTDHADASAAPDILGGPRPDPTTTASKDPEDWVTGDEPMTGPQRSYLDTLAREAGEELPGDLTKAQASEHIDRLQGVTGRGRRADDSSGGSAG